MARKILLLAAPLLFLLQWQFMHRFGEPYPALVLPAFGPAPTGWRTFHFDLCDAERVLQTASVDEMFADMPRSNRYVVPGKHLGGDISPEVQRWLTRLAQKINPHATRVNVRWTE